ncbi:hypothetical protein A1Q2_00081 [Trichosporon asahii var. asahii CBS 8904]|uniref:Uncharacterized protein n=1 Tax=Trichosporon asahii var. asahii (strain CBS 8904) TaxID=1220162 RepID=K1VYB1_TRIAC|nr:hypothetical protein A1Q2_00081 [Trichosporon asahii var. asahii CBS 8904]
MTTDNGLTQSADVKLPGLGLPIDAHVKKFDPTYEENERGYRVATYPAQTKAAAGHTFAFFPSAIEEESWRAGTVTTRERAMWAFMEAISDKPEWTRKVFDDTIVGKWYRELRERMGSEPTEGEFWNKAEWEEAECDDDDKAIDWRKDRDSFPSEEVKALPFPWNRGFSDAMFAWCVRELRDKARIEEKTGIVSALESSAAVLKSDSAIPADLKDRLRTQAARLEDVPDKDKDWHPGSNEQVLDLVHPSLFPLVYGRSRGFTDRVIASPEAALELIGAGEVMGHTYVPWTRERYKEALMEYRSWHPTTDEEWTRFNGALDRIVNGDTKIPGAGDRTHLSQRFQWLPAEVDVAYSEDGEVQCTFASYINNLHPVEYKELYDVCGGVLARVLPMFDAVYERVMSWDWEEAPRKRIEALDTKRQCTTPDACGDYCESDNMPRDEEDDSEDDDVWEQQEAWYERTHAVQQPNPPVATYTYPGIESFKSRDLFGGAKRLQVIVKMANIHLTPDKPAYEGGSWHLEGLHNERICATALYYYDVANISESKLALRTNGNGEGPEGLSVEFRYDQHDHAGPAQYFDIETDWDASPIQDHGAVVAREDRVLVFPNTYQHRVEPFELLDKSRPGHRKILAFFLVDPATPVVGTANVPPQQAHWGHAGRNVLEDRLPEELVRQVMTDVDCPYDLDTAKKIRLEFMDERSAKVDEENKELSRNGGWILGVGPVKRALVAARRPRLRVRLGLWPAVRGPRKVIVGQLALLRSEGGVVARRGDMLDKRSRVLPHPGEHEAVLLRRLLVPRAIGGHDLVSPVLALKVLGARGGVAQAPVFGAERLDLGAEGAHDRVLLGHDGYGVVDALQRLVRELARRVVVQDGGQVLVRRLAVDHEAVEQVAAPVVAREPDGEHGRVDAAHVGPLDRADRLARHPRHVGGVRDCVDGRLAPMAPAQDEDAAVAVDEGDDPAPRVRGTNDGHDGAVAVRCGGVLDELGHAVRRHFGSSQDAVHVLLAVVEGGLGSAMPSIT